MKPIPYDEIIAKANARKEALQRYDAALHDFVHHLPQLHAVIGVMEELETAIKAMDAEAMNLVGTESLIVLRLYINKVVSAYRSNNERDSYRHITPQGAFELLTGLQTKL